MDRGFSVFRILQFVPGTQVSSLKDNHEWLFNGFKLDKKWGGFNSEVQS
jgi:hypothetical protein